MGWKTEKDTEKREINITPEDEEHVWGGYCTCNPTFEIYEGWGIYYHKSEDFREFNEDKEKVIN